MRVNKLLLLINKNYYNGLPGVVVPNTTGSITTISISAAKRNGGAIVFSGGIAFHKAGQNNDQAYDSLDTRLSDRFDDTNYYTAN